MSQHSSTVLILGGGPAGGAAALGLAQAGCDVVLLERQAAPGWKIGETLPPESRVPLQRLKHWSTFRNAGHRPCHGIVSCWGSPDPVETDFMTNPYGHGWQLDRARFEADLLEAARDAGCLIFRGAEVDAVQYQSGSWRLSTAVGCFQSDWVLDCTGRRGILAKHGLGGSFEPLQDSVVLYCLLNVANGNDQDGRTYVESNPFGWSYSALMPTGSRIIAFLTDRDLIPEEAARSHWMRQRIQEGTVIQRVLNDYAYPSIGRINLASAVSGRYQHLAGDQWILVGDAAMTFDPLSGWGSAKALASAAEAVKTVMNGNDYQAAGEALWNNYHEKHRDYFLMEQRWPAAPFWSRRHRVSLA